MNLEFLEPWVSASDDSLIHAELQKELSNAHILFQKELVLVGRSLQTDDFLFKIDNSDFEYCIVHLTWSSKKETNPIFPSTKFYKNWEEFVEQEMRPIHEEYFG
jgi:hypothetical protein